MEIVNKNSYNHAVLHKLKIRQNNWRPSSPFPLVLWPYYATRVCYAEKYFVRHTHYENWIVCCVEKGCLQVICQGEVYNVRAGETILIPPGPHTFAAEEGETLQRALGIEGYFIRLILENLCLDRCVVLKGFLTKEYEELFEEVYTLLGKKDINNAPRLSLLGYAIIMYAARFVKPSDIPEEVILCQQFIQRNLFQKITLADLCAEAGCSRSGLSAMFRKYTGFSPGDYIIEQRHKYARDLLAASPHLSVKLVASHCGYRNQLYFANDFKKRTGMTPSQYREKMKKKV